VGVGVGVGVGDIYAMRGTVACEVRLEMCND